MLGLRSGNGTRAQAKPRARLPNRRERGTGIATATAENPTERQVDKVVKRSFKRRLARQLSSELGPPLLFFLAFMARDIYWACAVYAVAATTAVVVSWVRHRRVPTLPLVSAGLVVLFAGLTLALDDATFIKIKPTVTNGFFALVLGAGWLVGFKLIDRVLRPRFTLDETGLRALTLRVFLYLAALAIANEVAWRTLSTENWVIFKVFGLVAFNAAFAASQLPLVKRHLVFLGEARPDDDGDDATAARAEPANERAAG